MAEWRFTTPAQERDRREREGRPPEGEYVVFHERPFPKRLDRAFHFGAILVGIGAAIWTGTEVGLAQDLPEGAEGWLIVAVASLVLGALTYGAVRAVGMIVVGIYGGLQKKQYIVDWQDGPGPKRRG